jgi:hypothetical protein
MVARLIFSRMHSGDVFAAGLLTLGAVGLGNKPLDIATIPEFSPLPLTVKTASFGRTSAEVKSVTTVALQVDQRNGGSTPSRHPARTDRGILENQNHLRVLHRPDEGAPAGP